MSMLRVGTTVRPLSTHSDGTLAGTLSTTGSPAARLNAGDNILHFRQRPGGRPVYSLLGLLHVHNNILEYEEFYMQRDSTVD